MNGRRSPSLVAAVALAAAAAVAVAAGGAVAHAALDEGGAPIPAWVKTVFGYYVAGDIGDGELIGALQYLIDLGVITLPGGGDGAASEPAAAAAMSEEAKSLARQADIAACLADESRDIIAGWELGARAARDYTSEDYAAEMSGMVAAGRASVQAAEAWAAVARQAAADGSITATERADIAAADNDMAAADADLYDAIMNTAAGEFMDDMADSAGGFFEVLLQTSTIGGAETECY